MKTEENNQPERQEMRKIKIIYRIPDKGVSEDTDIYTERKIGDVETNLEIIVREIDPNYEDAKQVIARIHSVETINGIIYE